HLAVRHEAVSLEREGESIRHLDRPFGKGGRLLRAIIGSVHLDRGKLSARIFELPLLGQIIRIKRAFPWLECPAAYTGANGARIAHSGTSSICEPLPANYIARLTLHFQRAFPAAPGSETPTGPIRANSPCRIPFSFEQSSGPVSTNIVSRRSRPGICLSATDCFFNLSSQPRCWATGRLLPQNRFAGRVPASSCFEFIPPTASNCELRRRIHFKPLASHQRGHRHAP